MKRKTRTNSGIKLVGYFAAPTGLGQIARNTLGILDRAGIAVEVECVPTPHDSIELIRTVEDRPRLSRGTFQHVLAFIPGEFWITELFHQGRVDLRTQHVTAVWAWELEEMPEFFEKTLRYADQIFALSDFSAKALAKGLKRQVTTFPTFGENRSRAFASEEMNTESAMWEALEVPKKYLLSRFDAKSFIKRKNPDAILDVWDAIYAEYPNVHLVIKTSNLSTLATSTLLERISKTPRVVVIDHIVPHELNAELMGRALAYISLHRAEGLGLNILEAVAADIPAVFTAYSGITNEVRELGFPVKFTKGRIGDGEFPYPSYGTWADADISDAVLQAKRAIDLVLSGEWKEQSDFRRKWIDDFYSRSNAKALEMVQHTLLLEKNPLDTSKRRVMGLFILLNKIWWHLPMQLRKLMSPIVRPMYRKLLL
jgi:glycosyltransferase involved in cell wall biosynthesis